MNNKVPYQKIDLKIELRLKNFNYKKFKLKKTLIL